MPQAASFILDDKDGTDTTFTPTGIVAGVARFKNGTGVPVGDRLITVQHSRTGTGREKATVKLTLPVVQDVTVSGITKPTVVRTAYCDMTFTFDGASSTDERANALAFAKNFLASALGIAVIRDLEDVY